MEPGIGGDGVPKSGVLLGVTELSEPGLAPIEVIRVGRWGRAEVMPVIEDIVIRADHTSPDHPHLNRRGDHHSSQGEKTTHGMTPHADLLGIDRRITLNGRYGIKDIVRVSGVAISPASPAF